MDFRLLKWKIKLWLSGWFFTLRGMKFRTEGMEFIIPKELTDIYLRGQFQIDFYEREERKYLRQYLNKNATVLELGACLGIVSCYANKLLSDKRRQVVVEANPNLIEHIERNRVQNNCEFKIEQVVISNKPENVFYLGDMILQSSMNRTSGRSVIVKGVSIEDIEKKYDLNFDTLIMDIEGGEFDLIAENKEKLKAFHAIFMEIHPVNIDDKVKCLAMLEDIGFRLVLDDSNFWILTKIL